MKKYLTIAAGILSLSSMIASAEKVVAYYPNWATYGDNYQPSDIPAQNLKEIVYAFAQVGNCAPPYATEANPTLCRGSDKLYATGVQDYQLYSTDPYSDFNKVPKGYNLSGTSGKGNISQVLQLGVPVLLSIGGYTLTVPLTTAMDDAHRAKFVQSVVDFLDTVKADSNGKTFSGVDIDWEPNGNQWRFADGENGHQMLQDYINLLSDLKAALPSGENEITIAAPASPSVITDVDGHYNNQFWSTVAGIVDHINVMTYDYHGTFPGEKLTGFNGPLYFDPTQPSNTNGRGSFNVSSTINAYLQVNVPAQKLYLGVPTYGRVYAGVPVQGTPLGAYQSFSGPGQTKSHDGIMQYRDIIKNPDFKQTIDNDAGQMTAYNSKSSEFVTFDNPTTLAAKVAYAKSIHLGGVMFWDLTGDTPAYSHDSLIQTAYTA